MFRRKKSTEKEAMAKKPKDKADKETKAAVMNEKTDTSAPEQQKMSLRYVDRLECNETFADSINTLSFDGQSLRIEFGVTRLDERKSNEPLTGRRYPACRLALTPAAAIDLINKMQQIGAALTQAGVIKTVPTPQSGGKAATG